MGYAFLNLKDGVPASDLKATGNTIENQHYRVTHRSRRPAPSPSCSTRPRATTSPAKYQGWSPGEYIYETVDHPDDRLAIADISFDKPEFFTGHKDTPWVRETATKVTLGEAKIYEGRASITVTIEAPGVHSATATYALDAGTKSVLIDWSIDKIDHTNAEAVFFAFPFKLDAANFMLDLNGIPVGAQRRPARWRRQGLVPGRPLGRCQRRQARRDARAARCAAAASRRHHHRQVGPHPSSRGPDHHVVGAQQPLAGELRGQPERRHPASATG